MTGCSIAIFGQGDKPLTVRVWTNLDSRDASRESFGIANVEIQNKPPGTELQAWLVKRGKILQNKTFCAIAQIRHVLRVCLQAHVVRLNIEPIQKYSAIIMIVRGALCLIDSDDTHNPIDTTPKATSPKHRK